MSAKYSSPAAFTPKRPRDADAGGAMSIDCTHADAFSPAPYGGNPACVVVLPSAGEPHAFPHAHIENEPWMQLVAREMQLSETAFLVRLTPYDAPAPTFRLRWFTPTVVIEKQKIIDAELQARSVDAKDKAAARRLEQSAVEREMAVAERAVETEKQLARAAEAKAEIEAAKLKEIETEGQRMERARKEKIARALEEKEAAKAEIAKRNAAEDAKRMAAAEAVEAKRVAEEKRIKLEVLGQ